ncbi:MAG: flippase-like domain-containing protein [Planctomycetaceae bacterium]|nr:flippase-like domain-containing protein [Planctomycetaceae bacterium]
MSHNSDQSPDRHGSAAKRVAWYRTKSFQLVIGVAVTCGCLWLAARVMANGRPLGDLVREIADAFSRADYRTLPVILAILGVFYWIKAWRWRMLLVPLGDFPTRVLFPPVMIGFAANNLLPAHLGDLVRVFVFARQQRQPLTAVFTSVALERVLDAIAILSLLGLGLLLTPKMNDPGVRTTMLVVAAAICVALMGAAVYLIWTKPFVRAFEWCLGRVPFLPEAVKHKLARMLEDGAAGLASLKHRHLWIGLMFTSFLQWSLNAAVIYLALWSFGIHVSPWVSCIVMGATAFGVTVPASPGYFGVIQLCFLAVLRFFTDDTVGVGAASIYYHMVQWIPVTFTGAYFFFRTGIRISDVTEQPSTASF